MWLVLAGLAGGAYWLYRQKQKEGGAEQAQAQCEELLSGEAMPDAAKKAAVKFCVRAKPEDRKCFSSQYATKHTKRCQKVVAPAMAEVMTEIMDAGGSGVRLPSSPSLNNKALRQKVQDYERQLTAWQAQEPDPTSMPEPPPRPPASLLTQLPESESKRLRALFTEAQDFMMKERMHPSGLVQTKGFGNYV